MFCLEAVLENLNNAILNKAWMMGDQERLLFWGKMQAAPWGAVERTNTESAEP